MSEAVLSSTYLRENSDRLIQQKTSLNRWKRVFVSSLLSALFFGGTGLLISGLAYFQAFEDGRLSSRIGAASIILAAFSFFLTAHSLDKIDLQKMSGNDEKPIS